MSGPLAAVREFFVAPASVPRERESALPAPPPSYAVLGERGDAGAVAAGLVLAAGGTGMVCTWASKATVPSVFSPAVPDPELVNSGPATAAPPVTPSAPATASARRLARRLASRGLGSAARGRLAIVTLPPEPDEAVAAARRAAAAADTACAVVVAGPREESLDTLLALNDAIVLAAPAGPESALVRLAEKGLADLGPPVVCIAPPTGLVRRLAQAGLLALPSLRAQLEPVRAR